MIRRRVIVGLSALGILLTAILVVAAVIGATQTAWGRGHIRTLLVGELRRIVHGRVYVGDIEGSLFTNLTIDSIDVRDSVGTLFLATGRLHAEFDPRDLLDRRILLQRLEVTHPYVLLAHYHDDTWNFKRILSPAPAPRSAPARAIARARIPEAENRGFGDFIMAAVRAGFGIDHIGEHAPDAAFAARYPRAEKYVGWPMLVVLALVAEEAGG